MPAARAVPHARLGVPSALRNTAFLAATSMERVLESGKGFAVVANEVKDLARETAKATDEVASKVRAIQDDANDLVASLAGISEIVERNNETQAVIGGVLTEQISVSEDMVS